MNDNKTMLYEIADQIASKYRTTGAYDHEAEHKLIDLADKIGSEISFDDDYIMVDDDIFYLTDRE